jgi:hypothetical protein
MLFGFSLSFITTLPHQKNKPDLLACSRAINYSDDEISDGMAFTDIENAADYG